MTMATPAPFRQTTPARTSATTARLAWLIMSVSAVCCVLLCGLAGYGLWRFRASIMGPQGANVLEAYASPVSLIHAGEVQAIAVSPRQRTALHEGETVRVGEGLRPGANAVVTLWDGSTLQLYANTRVIFRRLQATLYSDRFQEVVLEVPAGQVLVGVAQTGQYQQVHFSVRTPEGTIGLEPGGTYLLRVGWGTELAVRRFGQAHILAGEEGSEIIVEADEKVVVQTGRPLVIEPARWELLENGGFVQGLEGWTFRSDQAGDGGDVDARVLLEQKDIEGQPVWAIGLERRGGLQDRCQAILFQEVEEDLSVYRSLRLDLDLRINYQSLPGGGPLGVDYPFNVRIRYRDAEGKTRQYTYGFYDHTEAGFVTDFPDRGETRLVPHYRWEPISLELLDLQPRPALLTGVDLMASGNDYLSWVANVSLIAE